MENTTPLENNKEYSLEEFRAKFNNFYLIFALKEPTYLANIKGFLSINHGIEFADLTKQFQERGNNISAAKVVEDNIHMLHKLYLSLKKDGLFSNRQLGLNYW